MPPSRPLKLVALASLVAGALACARPGGPETTSNEFGGDHQVFKTGLKCTPVTSAERLPPRAVVTDPGAAVGDDNTIFTSALFDRFNAQCGSCHVASNYGNWAVPNKGVFAQLVTRDIVDRRIKTDVAGEGGYMPPAIAGGRPFSQRPSTDPVAELAKLLDLWLAQGSPLGQFSLVPSDPDGGAPDGGASDGGGPAPAAPPAMAPSADYTLTPQQGAALTNIGTCVPNRYAVGLNQRAMDGRDEFFAHATELPTTLAETDLITFESETLARDGVVSFVPAYPLWSDSAGKMRHVRVPRGQSISFDARTQQFSIPRNTRFYKTFFKKVIQLDGTVAEKKIETRLIVSRPDYTHSDGTVETTALFGTYLWNAAETEAVLLTDPQHDGNPFADRLLTYVADEPRAAAIRASNPRSLEYALDVENPGVRRHYAVPSANRCVQCHMGSPSASFVLGFTPLEIATRAPGFGGVIETTAGDELTQLERLISYGVISGMTSPAQVLPLEQSQLPRVPRNEYELRAQAYMIGNCAHCHNPRGFPSIKAPELKEVLDFLPSAKGGGIFQLPLELTSPRRARGPKQDTPLPYITPSLYDVYQTHGGGAITKGLSCSAVQDESLFLYCPAVPEGTFQGTCGNGLCETQDLVMSKPEDDTNCPDDCLASVKAPWRSLIYRNVDTPFDYVDDATIYPHMPMNTPGYDCRAAQIMGDWMVSIPAARVSSAKEAFDETAVPYVEVKPGDAAYSKATADAKKRLDLYHAGHRYDYCPDTSDIVDPSVGTGTPPVQTPASKPVFSASPQRLVMPPITPLRGHWVMTDATDPPGDWLPRGADWKDGLVHHMVAADAGLAGKALIDLKAVIATLPDVRITPQMKQAFLTEVPFATWRPKPECDFSSVPKAGDFQGDARPNWFHWAVETRDPAQPIYALSPGAAVFTNICVNCHGPKADAKGVLADEISVMTGGNARVANFRAGLFGPLEGSGTNRARVFGPDALAPETADDLGARYLTWMALGGTRKQIPPDLLNIVAVSPVAGTSRAIGAQTGSANMLQLARQLCNQVLVSNSANAAPTLGGPIFFDWTFSTNLIAKNGDAELWVKLCSFDNRPVVRVLYPNANGVEGDGQWTLGLSEQQLAGAEVKTLSMSPDALYWGDAYPPDAEVLDQHGHLKKGLTPENVVPTCVRKPADAGALSVAERSRHIGGADGYTVPWCPESLFERGADGKRKWQLQSEAQEGGGGQRTYPDADQWATRGAINAGFAVFLYLDQLSKGLVQPKPLYNQCDLLPKGGGP